MSSIPADRSAAYSNIGKSSSTYHHRGILQPCQRRKVLALGYWWMTSKPKARKVQHRHSSQNFRATEIPRISEDWTSIVRWVLLIYCVWGFAVSQVMKKMNVVDLPIRCKCAHWFYHWLGMWSDEVLYERVRIYSSSLARTSIQEFEHCTEVFDVPQIILHLMYWPIQEPYKKDKLWTMQGSDTLWALTRNKEYLKIPYSV